MFFVLSRVSNFWIGLVLTLHFQFTVNTRANPTYTHLAMTFFLAELSLVLWNRKYVGWAFGALLLGAMVRGELVDDIPSTALSGDGYSDTVR
jgi:hypothetical protein